MGNAFSGVGRTAQSEDVDGPFGGANIGFGYAGSETGDALDVGFGLVNSDNLQLLQAMGSVGAWESDGGIQIGAKGEASLWGLGGSLGDMAGVFGADVTDSDQGGWENFLSMEFHGPSAGMEASVGNEGIIGGAGAELAGSSIQVGGAEYDWMFGQEISVGAGVGGGGANFGATWTDDDEDGVPELGLALGGEFGFGMDVAAKNELAGHAWNTGQAAWDWAFGADEETEALQP